MPVQVVVGASRRGQAGAAGVAEMSIDGDDPQQIVLELRRGSEPIEGEISCDGVEATAFVGWLGLVTAVDAIRASGIEGAATSSAERHQDKGSEG